MPEKYQDEIEEILRRSSESALVKSPLDRQQPPDNSPEDYFSPRDDHQVHAGSVRRWPSLSPGKVMLGGLVVFVIGALWFSPLIWVGLAILVGAYLLFFVRPGSTSLEKRWRGRSMEEQSSSVDKLKKWIRN